jgi:pilus assembly protein CpaE
MPAGLSFVIASPQREFEAALESSVHVEIRAHVERFEELVQTVELECPDALLVALGEDPQAAFAALEKLPTPKPLLFFCGPDDSQLILQAMRMGAREYVAPAPDEKDQLLAAVERVARETSGSAELQPAPLIAVTGAKGGVGTSFVACQLAASLAQLGGRPALVDGQLRRGDVALYLNLTPHFSFASLANHSEAIDPTFLQTILAGHSSGVQVLAAPKYPEEADVIGPDCIDTAVRLLRTEFDWVIWDTPQDFDDRGAHVLDRATTILMVTTPDVPAMNHTRLQLDLLKRLGYPGEQIRIVVNRVQRSASVSPNAAQEFLGRPVDASIPNDYPRVSACLEEGRTLDASAPRSAVARSLAELALQAHSWCDRPSPVPARRGLLHRLRGK